jgi:hypothetical protein
MITAYDYIKSLEKYSKFLEEDRLYANMFNSSVNYIAQTYCEKYFNDNFYDNSNAFKPKEILNEYELNLFRQHPAFIEDPLQGVLIFKGMNLIKKENKK